MEPEVLTTKDDTKQVPCRECGRPCIVSRFMAPGKVACTKHQGRRAEVTVMRSFDDSLEEHVLTDKTETKAVPCRECGRRCIVTRFMAAEKVTCRSCRADQSTRTRTRTTSSSEGGTTLQDESFFGPNATEADVRRALTLRKIRISRPGPSGKMYDYEYGVFRVVSYDPETRAARYTDTYTMGSRYVRVDDIVWIGKPKSAGWPKDVTYAGRWADPHVLEKEARG